MSEKFFLTKATYIEQKRQIAVEFSNETKKFTKRFSFFPCLFVSLKEVPKKAFLELLGGYDRKRIKIELLQGEIAKITASTFEDLKKVQKIIISSFFISPLLLNPERQFLIQKEWSYFDSFYVSEEKQEKLQEFALPELYLDFLPKTLKGELEELLKEDKIAAKKLLESIILSNSLCLHFAELPKTEFAIREALLERIFFKNSFAPNKKVFEKAFSSSSPFFLHEIPQNAAEFDFSFAWPTLFTFPFYNIGPDTMNCECCKPKNLLDSNVAPNSMLEVEFLSEGIYFESLFPAWAGKMHSLLPDKKKREKKQKEWFLPSIPLGPFQRHQTALIPFPDAVFLLKNNKARILSNKRLSWFCRTKESFISREIIELNKKTLLAQKELEQLRTKKSTNQGITLLLSPKAEPEELFFEILSSTLQKLIESIPRQLSCTYSLFYYSEIAECFDSLKAVTLNAFRESSAEEGCRTARMGDSKVMASSGSPLALVEQFSEKKKLPIPRIK